jgi:hypothetical protein
VYMRCDWCLLPSKVEAMNCLIPECSQVSDPLQTITPGAATYSKAGRTFHLCHYVSSTLPKGTVAWATQLVHRNVGVLYDREWGWDQAGKEEELGAVRSSLLSPTYIHACSDGGSFKMG